MDNQFDASIDATNEFFDKLDSLKATNSLDDSTRYCVDRFLGNRDDGHGGHDVADLTKKEGICLDFDVQNQIVSVQLDMGDSLNAIVNGDLFAAEFSIDDFKDL